MSLVFINYKFLFLFHIRLDQKLILRIFSSDFYSFGISIDFSEWIRSFVVIQKEFLYCAVGLLDIRLC